MILKLKEQTTTEIKKGAYKMNAVHILQDGSRPASIEGIVIKNEQFYKMLIDIQTNLNKRKYEANKKLCS